MTTSNTVSAVNEIPVEGPRPRKNSKKNHVSQLKFKTFPRDISINNENFLDFSLLWRRGDGKSKKLMKF